MMNIAEQLARAKSDYDEVHEAGKTYAYDNPQTPTDGRNSLADWYAYLNRSLGFIWDDDFDESTDWEVVVRRDDESTWLESLEYPKGTSRIAIFDAALTTRIWDEYVCSWEAIGIPTRKFTGTLDMSSATSAYFMFGIGSKVQDAGTIILPTSPDCQNMKNMCIYASNLTKIRFVGKIQWDMSFANASHLDGDTIRHIVGALSGTTTGKTLTLRSDAIEAAMSWDKWEELIAPITNWTFTLK